MNQEPLDDLLGDGPLKKLYSKSPIIWYSFLFSPFVGGLLLCINLFRLKKQGQGLLIVFAALAYSLGTAYLATLIEYSATSRLIALLLNLFAGNLLGGPVWKNTIGKMPFSKANPWLPLIFVVFVLVVTFVGAQAFIYYTLSAD